MGSSSLIRELADGTIIEMRPIEAGDREILRQAFEALSPESRYRRFFGPMPELSERDLTYLTQVDHHDHEALVGFERGSGQAIAVARFVRTGPDVAEPAIVVADGWQGRGVGTALLEALVDRALAEGVHRFDAPVLASNAAAIRTLERLGRTVAHREGPEVRLVIDLPAPAEPRFTWSALLHQFAAGAVEPARTVLDWLWPRRAGSADDPHDNVIVLGTDGTSPSSSTLDLAAELARASGARVEVVAAYRFGVGHQDELAAAVARTAEALRRRGIGTGEHVRRGDPALVLADVAAQTNARLIVVGGAEPSKGSRRIVGGVSDSVAERAPCNVLIVRARHGERGDG